jgi:hypothetical protein
MYYDYMNYQLSRVFLEYEGDRQLMAIDAVRNFFASPSVFLSAAIERFALDARKFYAVAAFFAAAVTVACLFKYTRFAKSRGEHSREESLKGKFLMAMKRRGYEKRASEGLEEFADSVRSASGGDSDLSAMAAEFVQQFESFYFREMRIGSSDFAKLNAIVKKISGGAAPRWLR